APPLSYDDNVPYEEQLPQETAQNSVEGSLASRIGTNRLYLLEESSALALRSNAILLHGSPIAHLPTARIFAYTAHFDVKPMGLEWLDDTTCVLVFATKALAKGAYRSLQKSPVEEPDDDGFITAKPIPVTLWPPEERINKTLGVGEGLKGVIGMRPAREDDVKKKGAKKESQFYKKHGETAGKEVHAAAMDGLLGRMDGDSEPRKRRHRDGDALLDREDQKRRLDAELDDFLAADDDQSSKMRSDLLDDAPVSKMRSDYIESDGRSLLQRTSVMRSHNSENSNDRWESGYEERPKRPLPRREGRRNDRAEGKGRERVHKTQQELDDELDAFLNDR
ncbi:hypothetical protein BD410DRAFT_686018, partial [Rickenella mellea]